MKILLINPTYYTTFGRGLSYMEPLGLAYLAGMIEEDGDHNVEILDSVGLAEEFPVVHGKTRIGLADEDVFKILEETDFDILGVSLISYFNEKEILDFVVRLKEKYQSTPIILGGPYATFEWKRCMATKAVDFIVIGEAEDALVELLHAIDGEKDVDEVKGVIYKNQDGEIIQTPPRPAVDIHKIPFPARHLLPMDNYMKYRPKQYQMRNPATTIFTSRACPFNCTFCSTKSFWNRKWRGRTVDSIIEEIELLIRKYGVKEIMIQDDNFLVDRRRVIEFCGELIKRKLKITWKVPPGMAVWLLDEELLIKMKESGLYMIRPQLETGNPRTLKYINKKIDFAHARNIIKIANRLGLWTITNMIIGFYYETKEEVQQTIDYAESLGVDNVDYLIAQPFPYTKMYDDFISNNIIKPGQKLELSYDIDHFSASEILEVQISAKKRIKYNRLKQIFNPRYFFEEFYPKVNSLEKVSFFLKRIYYG